MLSVWTTQILLLGIKIFKPSCKVGLHHLSTVYVGKQPADLKECLSM